MSICVHSFTPVIWCILMFHYCVFRGSILFANNDVIIAAADSISIWSSIKEASLDVVSDDDDDGLNWLFLSKILLIYIYYWLLSRVANTLIINRVSCTCYFPRSQWQWKRWKSQKRKKRICLQLWMQSGSRPSVYWWAHAGFVLYCLFCVEISCLILSRQ